MNEIVNVDKAISEVCKCCKFWKTHYVLEGASSEDVNGFAGECRRFPPKFMGTLAEISDAQESEDNEERYLCIFPVTSGDCWCGEFKSK